MSAVRSQVPTERFCGRVALRRLREWMAKRKGRADRAKVVSELATLYDYQDWINKREPELAQWLEDYDRRN